MQIQYEEYPHQVMLLKNKTKLFFDTFACCNFLGLRQLQNGPRWFNRIWRI